MSELMYSPQLLVDKGLDSVLAAHPTARLDAGTCVPPLDDFPLPKLE